MSKKINSTLKMSKKINSTLKMSKDLQIYLFIKKISNIISQFCPFDYFFRVIRDMR